MTVNTGHDIPIAIFKLYEAQEEIHLSVVMDLEDLVHFSDIISDNIEEEKVLDYLNSHTAWFFDDRLASIQLLEVKQEREHLHIIAKLDTLVKDFSKIKVKNTCLNEVRNHSNIIQVELGEEIKDFRMHKGRTKIEVEI